MVVTNKFITESYLKQIQHSPVHVVPVQISLLLPSAFLLVSKVQILTLEPDVQTALYY